MVLDKDKLKSFITSLIVIISYILWATFIQFPLSVLKVHNNVVISIYEVIINIIYLIVMYLLFYKDISSDIKKSLTNKKKTVINITLCILSLFFIMLLTNILSFFVFKKIILPNNDISLVNGINKSTFTSLFYLLMFSPFIEELVFRLNLRKVYKNSIVFIIISSVLLGLYYLIYNDLNILFISYYLVGLFLSIMYVKTDNIIINIISRIIYNLILFILVIL